MKLIIMNKKTLIVLLILIGLIILALIFGFLYNKTEEIFNPDVYYQGTIDEKTMAFACNVDWGNDYIPDMLEIFKNNDIKITFFVTGKWAEKNKDLLKEISDSGHEIGNHGYSHLDYDKLSYERNKEEIDKADNIIKDITETVPKYFAPPSGAFNDFTLKASKELGYELILWSIDTIDWRKDSTRDIIIKRVIDKAHNSAIVLMHPTCETVKALPDIINQLSQKGYKIGSISDIVNLR